MNRLIALLLIPQFVLLPTWAHTHAGVDSSAARGQSLRPHVHFSAGHHHHQQGGAHHDAHVGHHHASGHSHPHAHDNQRQQAAGNPAPSDHDETAIYLADPFSAATPVAVFWTVDAPAVTWGTVDRSLSSSSTWWSPDDNPPDRYGGLPIFLLTASLRL